MQAVVDIVYGTISIFTGFEAKSNGAFRQKANISSVPTKPGDKEPDQMEAAYDPLVYLSIK